MKLNDTQIQKAMIILIRLTLVFAILGSAVNFRWSLLFGSSVILVLTFVPFFFEKRYDIQLPIEFESIIILFIYASLFLGEVHSYYTTFWWWDIFLHTGSGIALGFAGFLIMYTLQKSGKIEAHPIWIAIFAFSFGVAFGAVWEIFEFSMDQIFGYNMQNSGLVDTMWDLIVDSIGALIVCVSGYFYLKGDKVPVFTNLITNYEKENQSIVKKNSRVRVKKKK